MTDRLGPTIMHQVTSSARPVHQAPPTRSAGQRARAWILRAGVALLCLGLVLGAGASNSAAEDLKDRADEIRRALVQSKKDISSAQDAVSEATENLRKSEASLARAQRKLAVVEDQLAEARERDAATARRLASAQEALTKAEQAVVAGQAEVAAQYELIGEAVREAYQQRTPLMGLSVVFDAESTADLSQRLQWSTTIFDSSSAELDRLRAMQASLQAAQETRKRVAEQVEAEKRATAAELVKTRTLEAATARAKAAVSAQVASNAEERKAAQEELADEQEEYREYQAEDRRVQAEIRQRIAAAKKAEAKRRAAEAAKKAAARKAGRKYVAPRRAESSRGFVSPVNANPGSPFGMRFHPIHRRWILHRGQDFGAPCGANIYAVANGRVASARWQGGFGRYTVIDHGRINGSYVSTGYAHQARFLVRAGQRVRQGQLIGYIGTTGVSTGCHLHFQVYVNGGVVNPMRWL
jgi:murein DD-endopeptidase MepM/ murein hydrolase activator NlpD